MLLVGPDSQRYDGTSAYPSAVEPDDFPMWPTVDREHQAPREEDNKKDQTSVAEIDIDVELVQGMRGS